MDYQDQLKNAGKAVKPERWKPSLLAIAALVILGFMLYRGFRKEAPRPKPPKEPVRESRPRPVESEPCPADNAEPMLFSGRLLFEGRPIGELTPAKPGFWFRNEGTGRAAEEVRSCMRGEGYVFWNLAPGRYGVQVSVNSNQDNPIGYPGDYQTWHTFDVPPRPDRGTDIDLMRVLHLTAPQDNGRGMGGWDEPCEKKPAFKSPVTFSWEPVGPGVDYRYAVDRGEMSSTRESSATLTLEKGCHEFRVYAHRGARRIGYLLTHGTRGGLGWSYSFRVE
ncbi:MAG TPA: hypothetical protein DCM05_11585 [Elusimicrobia bacterium]|nr:hypothetical protein [Elusimicrobiota bacterium]